MAISRFKIEFRFFFLCILLLCSPGAFERSPTEERRKNVSSSSTNTQTKFISEISRISAERSRARNFFERKLLGNVKKSVFWTKVSIHDVIGPPETNFPATPTPNPVTSPVTYMTPIPNILSVPPPTPIPNSVTTPLTYMTPIPNILPVPPPNPAVTCMTPIPNILPVPPPNPAVTCMTPIPNILPVPPPNPAVTCMTPIPNILPVPPPNPVILTPTNPDNMPVTNLPTPPITVPVINPYTNPPITVPTSTPVTNPVTTYPFPPPGTIPVLNPVPAPPVLNPVAPSGTSNTPVGIGQGQGQTWCVAKTGALDSALQAALDYACGIGGVDCSAIQDTGNCYNPNSIESHASYAFNSYYQRNPVPSSCDFGGTAVIVNTNPSTVSCVFPSYSSSSMTGASSNMPSSVLNRSNPATVTTNVFGSEPPSNISASLSFAANLRPVFSVLLAAVSFVTGRLVICM